MAMIAGLVGNVVVNIILQALIVQELILPLSIIMALTLVIACHIPGHREAGMAGTLVVVP